MKFANDIGILNGELATGTAFPFDHRAAGKQRGDQLEERASALTRGERSAFDQFE